MIKKQFFSEKRIIDCLKTNYSIDVATLTFLHLGADMNASVYKAQAHDGSSYFIKLKPDHLHDISFAIVELLHHAGIQQVIPPVSTTQGEPTQSFGDFRLIVYPFIEGQDGFSCNLTDHQWITLGKALKQVHETNLPSSIQARVRQEAYSSQWRESVRSLYTYLEAELIGDEITLELSAFMKDNRATILRLVDRAEQLGQKLQDQSSQFVLCHSDIHAGNVMMAENHTLYIVDWDDPILAPKERDLMFIGGGVGNVWNKPQQEELFYEGYGKSEINTEILAYYRYERIVEDIALFGHELLLTTSEDQDRLGMYKLFLSMFEPQGVVEIAFKTDKGLAI